MRVNGNGDSAFFILKKKLRRNSMDPMLRRTIRGVLVTLPLVLLVSCGARPVGYGVVLWGEPEGEPRTGAVVPVLQESKINSTCLISVDKKQVEYTGGRIRLFKKRAEAAAFATAYASQLYTWAVVVKEDSPPLPMRAEPNADAKVVYKLQYRQMVKVVSRSAAKASVKPYSDYWYELVTEDGFSGFCFGHFLKPYTTTADPQAEAQAILSQDETLARIMGTTWRPSWFLDMTGRGAVDLDMYREDVGFFPDPEAHVMRLVLPLSTFEFAYTGEPQKAGARSYTFPGTDLRVDVLDDERIAVSYRYKDQPKTDTYVVVSDDVAEVVAKEQLRRAELWADITAAGTVLASSAYGTIRLDEDMGFSWEGFGKLVPSLIPSEARGRGRIDLTLHVGKELAGSYDGAITFIFDEKPGAGVSFLYKKAGDGLRFTSLARDSLRDLFVTHPSMSPVVIFFNQSK
jgi:hypothetical protein